MNALVSIIMPAYNVGDYVAESILSIQKQTYPNWELIVVNDGSTDHTPEVVRNLAEKDTRIRLYTQENGGVSSARNRGLGEAKGEHIAFLDGDDFWEPTFLEELLKAKKEAQVEMAYCGYDHFYAGRYRRGYRYGFPSGWILPDAIKGTVRLHICAILVDRQVFAKYDVRFTVGCPIGEDWEVIAKLLTHVRAESVPQSLMLYSVRPGSAIRSKWDWKKHIHGVWAQERVNAYIQDQLSGNELAQVKPLLIDSITYKTYRFLWRMVKYGYHVEALELMKEPKYLGYLEHLAVKDLKLIDRLKYEVTVSRNTLLWKVARKIL